MEDLLGVFGLLRIHVIRGINLARTGLLSSDPYIIVRLGKQKVKTRVIKKNVNPEWDEDLTLCVKNLSTPVKLQVYDNNMFTFDRKMGDAEFDIRPELEAVKKATQNVPNGTVCDKLKPSRQNCLAEESSIVVEDGKVNQHMFIRLRNVKRGELELQMEWIHVPGSRSL